MTDPIADFLTRIRNAQMANNKVVHIPYSREKEAIAQVMKKNKFLEDVQKDTSGTHPQLVVTLVEKKLNLQRVSRPGQRIYQGAQEIRKVNNGFGICIISTSRGVISGYEARAQNVGGEVLCEIS